MAVGSMIGFRRPYTYLKAPLQGLQRFIRLQMKLFLLGWPSVCRQNFVLPLCVGLLIAESLYPCFFAEDDIADEGHDDSEDDGDGESPPHVFKA